MNAEQIMNAAQEEMRRNAAFRRYVDASVNEAMRHAEQTDSKVDRRDLYRVATLAAMTALKLAFDQDHEIQRLQHENKIYRDQVLKLSHLQPVIMTIPTP